MNRRLFFTLIIVLLLLFTVTAGCKGPGRIGSFFQNEEYKQHTKLIDFMVFFTLFFALCFLGFSKWFGEGFGKPGSAKGAVIGLSIAISLALTFAIIMQTQFSIASIFPLAKAFLFLAFCLLLYGLLNQIIKSESTTGKIVTFILAVILVYILMNIFTHFVCQMGNNMNDPACKSDFFGAFSKVGERYLWGSGGWFSGWFGGGAGSGTVRGTGSSSSGEGSGQQKNAQQNGTGGSSAGTGSDNGGTGDDNAGAISDLIADTLPEKDEGNIFTNNWGKMLIILILLLLIGLWIWKRKKHMKKAQEEIEKLLQSLEALIKSQRQILSEIKLSPPQYTQADRQRDDAKLKNLMQKITANLRPGERPKSDPRSWRNLWGRYPSSAVVHKRPPKPKQGPLIQFFNKQPYTYNDNAGNTQTVNQWFAYYPVLTGKPRKDLENNLHAQNLIKWELYWLSMKRKRFWHKILDELNIIKKKVDRQVISPKFDYQGHLVTIMFDSRHITSIDKSQAPQIIFHNNCYYKKSDKMKPSPVGDVYQYSMPGLPEGRTIKYTILYFVQAGAGAANITKFTHDELNPHPKKTMPWANAGLGAPTVIPPPPVPYSEFKVRWSFM